MQYGDRCSGIDPAPIPIAFQPVPASLVRLKSLYNPGQGWHPRSGRALARHDAALKGGATQGKPARAWGLRYTPERCMYEMNGERSISFL